MDKIGEVRDGWQPWLSAGFYCWPVQISWCHCYCDNLKQMHNLYKVNQKISRHVFVVTSSNTYWFSKFFTVVLSSKFCLKITVDVNGLLHRVKYRCQKAGMQWCYRNFNRKHHIICSNTWLFLCSNYLFIFLSFLSFVFLPDRVAVFVL